MVWPLREKKEQNVCLYIRFIAGGMYRVNIQRCHSRDQHLLKNGLEQKKAFTGFVSNINMSVISLFRYTGIIGRHDVMWKRSTQWKTLITKDIKKTACTHLRKYAKLQYCAQHSLSFFSLAFSSRTVFCTSFLARSMTHFYTRITSLSASLPLP